MSKNISGSRTLLVSVIMSSLGALVLGLGLYVGQSSTQTADFIRRSSELLAIITSFVIYQITIKDGKCNIIRKNRLEKASNLLVGAAMCLGGAIMLLLAFFSSNTEKGNVIPGLVIALIGVVANSTFWRKYTRLNGEEPNAILAVQATLYRAKTFVDGCVTVALVSVALFPTYKVSYYLDLIGSVIVAVYLIWCGGKTIRESSNNSIGN